MDLKSNSNKKNVYYFNYSVIQLIFQFYRQKILHKFLKHKLIRFNFIKKQEYQYKMVL
jgi:hypothetical protein